MQTLKCFFTYSVFR